MRRPVRAQLRTTTAIKVEKVNKLERKERNENIFFYKNLKNCLGCELKLKMLSFLLYPRLHLIYGFVFWNT